MLEDHSEHESPITNEIIGKERELDLRKMELDLREREMKLALKESEIRLALKESEIERERMRQGENEIFRELKAKEVMTSAALTRIESFGRIGSLCIGVFLVGAAVVDGLFNPFAFMEAPQLMVSGVGLMLAGATGKDSEGKDD